MAPKGLWYRGILVLEKSAKPPLRGPPQGRGGDLAPISHEGHEAGALWYHLKHPLPSKAGNGISLPVLENFWSIPKLHQSRQLPERGVGGGHKKPLPLLFLAHPKGFTVGVQKEAGSPWLPPGQGGGFITIWQRVGDTPSPVPCREGKRKPKEWAEPTGRTEEQREQGWHRNLSPPGQRACPFSASQLPTATIHGWFS